MLPNRALAPGGDLRTYGKAWTDHPGGTIPSVLEGSTTSLAYRESPIAMSNHRFPRPNAKIVFTSHPSGVLWKYWPLNLSISRRRRDGRSVQVCRSLELQYSAQLLVQPKIPGCWDPDFGHGDMAYYMC